MSIRKVKIKNGEAKWEIRVHESGRGSKRITRRFDRKIDAELFVSELENEIRERERSPFKGSSFEDRLFKDESMYWLNDGKIRFSASHLKRVEGILKELLPSFGELTLDKFTPEFIARYQQEEKKRGSSNATVNRKTEVFTAILNFSTKHRRIPFNPSVGFKKLKKSSQEMACWSAEEATSFLTAMNAKYFESSSNRWIYVAYLLALNTAMRAGEIWGLQVLDLSQDGLSICVRRQFNRVTLDFAETKGKKSRFVPCHPELLRELRTLIKLYRLKSTDTFFRNKEGKPVCHDNFADRQFAKDIKFWQGRRIRFHDLRHTATTLMIANGVDIKTVKEVCGHADIATTMNYVHMVAGNVERVSRMFSLTPEKSEKDPIEMTLYKRG